MPQDVHPQVQAILDAATGAGLPKLEDLTPEQARKLTERLASARRNSYQGHQVASVEDTDTGASYGQVPVRIYRASERANAPVALFYHGGGHVFGSLDTHDLVARSLSAQCRCTVVSVDYRMGPEHPFPAAVDDAFAAARWVAENAVALEVDADRIALSGDSAGGNLAAVVALLAREHSAFSVSAQVLVYPVTDYRCTHPSYERYAEGYGLLEAGTMRWFQRHYLGGVEQAHDWRASPLLAEDLSNLPPALVLLAECDVLRDEGVAYAERLRDAGVDVEHTEYAGMVHGFFAYLGLVDDTERAHQRVAEFLMRCWSR